MYPEAERTGSPMHPKPKLVIIDGGDAVGKSSTLARLAEHLPRETFSFTAEPNDQIRAAAELIPEGDEQGLVDAFVRGRMDDFEHYVVSELEAGRSVISDRGFPSTMVYQGAVGGIDPDQILADHADYLNQISELADLHVIILTASEETVQNRSGGRSVDQDRFESASDETKRAVRTAFTDLAERHNWTLIDTTGLDVDEVSSLIENETHTD